MNRGQLTNEIKQYQKNFLDMKLIQLSAYTIFNYVLKHNGRADFSKINNDEKFLIRLMENISGSTHISDRIFISKNL